MNTTAKRSLAGDRDHNYLSLIRGSKMGSTATTPPYVYLPVLRETQEVPSVYVDGLLARVVGGPRDQALIIDIGWCLRRGGAAVGKLEGRCREKHWEKRISGAHRQPAEAAAIGDG